MADTGACADFERAGVEAYLLGAHPAHDQPYFLGIFGAFVLLAGVGAGAFLGDVSV